MKTLTVREMRTKLRETGAIGQNERPQVVPLIHYLLFRFDVTPGILFLVSFACLPLSLCVGGIVNVRMRVYVSVGLNFPS